MYATEEYLSNALDKITINVDVNKMMMVVRNLVSNALKFTPNGGEIQVKVRYDGELCQNDRSEGVIRIEVHDSGCGISKVI